MSRKKDEDPTTQYQQTEITELTGLTDVEWENKNSHPTLWRRIIRLVSGSPEEEHDKGRALRRAVRDQDIALVTEMINKGYGVNSSQEASLACICSRRMNIDMLKLLVEAGVDINKPDRRSQNSKARNSLQEASRKGWIEGVEYILEVGVEDINWCDEKDVSALHLAARAGHEDVVRLLLFHRADPCGAKHSALSPLHQTPSLSIMKMLIDAGAYINQKDKNKCTPLHLQTYLGRPKLVKMLMDSGAEINAFDRKGRTPLFLLGGKGDVNDVYEIFKEKSINFGIRDLNESNLAHAFSSRSKNLDLILALIKDCPPSLWEEKNTSGQTPLDIIKSRRQGDWVSAVDQALKNKA